MRHADVPRAGRHADGPVASYGMHDQVGRWNEIQAVATALDHRRRTTRMWRSPAEALDPPAAVGIRLDDCCSVLVVVRMPGVDVRGFECLAPTTVRAGHVLPTVLLLRRSGRVLP